MTARQWTLKEPAAIFFIWKLHNHAHDTMVVIDIRTRHHLARAPANWPRANLTIIIVTIYLAIIVNKRDNGTALRRAVYAVNLAENPIVFTGSNGFVRAGTDKRQRLRQRARQPVAEAGVGDGAQG